MQRIVKPKTQRGRRAVEAKEPKIFENSKSTLFFKGGNTSQTVTEVLKEWHALKKPNATIYSKKNVTRPFEDQSKVEFFTSKSDSSLFMFGSHSKKRPHNIVIGRLYDGQLLDMAEFGVEKFISMKDVKVQKPASGIKPCLVLSGDMFEETEDNKRLRNLFIDFFRGPNIDNICLSGMEHVINIHAVNGKIYIRNYKVHLKKSGSKTPRVELESFGLSLDLVPRRNRLASEDLFKRALKKPATAKPKKKKNISMDDIGNKLGRIHMQSQKFDSLQARKVKGLKRKKETVQSSEEQTDNSRVKKQKKNDTS